MKGHVKWFNNRRGYGFITGEDGTEAFVHYSGIISEGYKTLNQNADVSFDISQDAQGRTVAVNVMAIPQA